MFLLALLFAPAGSGAAFLVSGAAPLLASYAAVAEPALPARALPLAGLVAEADARWGVVRGPGAYAGVEALDPALAEVVADLLHALLWAAAERDAAFAGADVAAIAASPEAGLPEGIDVARVRSAAVGLAAAVDAARPRLEALGRSAPAAAIAPAPAIDLFPVLGIDPLGVPNVFPHDYFLSVDLGGDDVYDNNAGGSIIARGFKVGDPATFGPTVAGVTVGGEFEDSGEAYTATLAVDVAGDDTYGVYKDPSPFSNDPRCTSAPVVRRTAIQGTGMGGIGQLWDLAGDDVYRAKSIAQGTGHVAGVGILVDAAGNDRYAAVRSAQGAGLLLGVGLHLDLGGADLREFVAPPGGVWNGDRGRCDASARLGLGAGLLQGVGVLVDREGNDVYRIAAQGLGNADPQSGGVFLDLAGSDDYGGYPGRADGAQFVTTPAGGFGLFRDV